MHTEDTIKARLFVGEEAFVRRLVEALGRLPRCRYEAASDLLARVLGLLQGHPAAAEVAEALEHIHALKAQIACVHGCADVDEAKGYANLIASELRRWISCLRLDAAHRAARCEAGLRQVGDGSVEILAAVFAGRRVVA